MAAACQFAAVVLVAVKICPVLGVPLKIMPLILATVGVGYVPLRSPDAAPVGARELVVEASVASSTPTLPAATLLLVAALPNPKLVLAVEMLARSLRLLLFCSDPVTVELADIILLTLVVEAKTGAEAVVPVPPKSPAN